MIVGLPGTGIGGFFYVLAALGMPVRELYRRLRNRSYRPRWKEVRTQLLLAVLVVAAVWLSGELVGRLIVLATPSGASADLVRRLHPHALQQHTYNVIKLTFVLLTLAAIVLLHVAMYVARLIIRFSRRRQALRAEA